MDKKLVISSDMTGFVLKEELKEYLKDQGYTLEDVGMTSTDKPMYFYDAAVNISKKIQDGSYERGIVLCGTGIGVSQICNKFKGVFCFLGETSFAVKKSRTVNNSNILALVGLITTPMVAKELADIFLNTAWCQGETPERVEFLKGLLANCDDFGQVL